MSAEDSNVVVSWCDVFNYS